MEKVQITDGIHLLSGVSDLIITGDCGSPYYLWGDANGFTIVLDGITYVIFENPEDGYRSCGEIDIAKNNEVCTNTFPPQKILVKYFNGSNDGGWGSIWYYEFSNPETNELILKIGTDNYDDYYPMSILEYYPENLPINKRN